MRGVVDFTFLFLLILAALAFQNDLPLIAAGLFLVALFTMKDKLVLGLALAAGAGLAALQFLQGELPIWAVVGALFVFFLILLSRDKGAPALPEGYYPQEGYPPGY